MSSLRSPIARSLCALVIPLTLGACAHHPEKTDLGAIYNDAAQRIGDDRNPVVVIPGILGSKLEEPGSETPVWGAFTYGAADPDYPDGARLFALPMEEGVPLSQLRDDVEPTEVLDTLTVDVGLLRGLEIGAYIDILKTLAAGKYRDQSLGRSGAVDYAGLHYTCFQYPYDWRRDISEQAVQLHELIQDARYTAMDARGDTTPGKVDVIAHSMGGLVLRYYLRYGPNPLPDDGSLPPLTWEGADYVEEAILIGTPSAGSVLSFRQLVEGVNFVALITPTYQPAVLGTMPAIYQLLPRPRHARVVDAETGDAIDILDPDVWERFDWGLADPEQDKFLRWLLPDVDDADERRRIALDQLRKSLAKAKQFFDAIDRKATPPEGLNLYLIAGDAMDTPDIMSVNPETGATRISSDAPGDGTVTRSSALMDERVGKGYVPRLRSPIHWRGVQFLNDEHLKLTSDITSQNFVLYILLEQPR